MKEMHVNTFYVTHALIVVFKVPKALLRVIKDVFTGPLSASVSYLLNILNVLCI